MVQQFQINKIFKNMIKQFNTIAMVAVAAIVLVSCTNEAPKEAATISVTPTQTTVTAETTAGTSIPTKGDQVPNNLVCMVNDAYMGKQQLEVPFEGKLYYGCCEMCKERIPNDAKVRMAVDPHSLKKVDKATAYIVLIGDQDEVAYFESKDNYDAFLKSAQ
jgi:YHS domain-containing protein